MTLPDEERAQLREAFRKEFVQLLQDQDDEVNANKVFEEFVAYADWRVEETSELEVRGEPRKGIVPTKDAIYTRKIQNLWLEYDMAAFFGAKLDHVLKAGGLASGATLLEVRGEPILLGLLALLGVFGLADLIRKEGVRLTSVEAIIVTLLFDTQQLEPVTKENLGSRIEERYNVKVSSSELDAALTHLMKLKCVGIDTNSSDKLELIEPMDSTPSAGLRKLLRQSTGNWKSDSNSGHFAE